MMTAAVPISAQMMKEFAEHLKAQLPKDQQAIIDALILTADINLNRYPSRTMVARLRGAALQHKSHAPVLAIYMESTANYLEQTP